MITGSVARRYAKALSLIADEKNLWSEIMEDLKAVVPYWNSKEFKEFIHEPSLTRKQRADVIVAFAQKAGLCKIVQNFLEVLALKGRLEFLPDIVRELEKNWEERQGKIKVIVKTPKKLSERLRENLEKAVKNRTGKNPVILEVIDERLIGGITVEIEGRVYNGSVKEMIKKLVQVQEIKI